MISENVIIFLSRQIRDIRNGGWLVLLNKSKLLLRKLYNALKLPIYLFALIIVFCMRIMRPLLIFRIGDLIGSRIGHFAGNTELYLCERDAGISLPRKYHIDIFYINSGPLSNKQLAVMWGRKLRIWPAWIMEPIDLMNRIFPGGEVHVIGQNTQDDRDVHNLMEGTQPHLEFTEEELARGQMQLLAMGVPPGAQFICILARDSAYLNHHFNGGNFDYHKYRDSDIQNYVLAAEELANRGYYVIRMGAKVRNALNSSHPRVIDYAANGMRSDFMDIYLGAKCFFTISSQAGWDCVPYIFRRPICYVNAVPLGYFMSFQKNVLYITKHHMFRGRALSCKDIFSKKVGFCLRTYQYESEGIDLVENSPSEIRDLAFEMVERLTGAWRPLDHDEALQERFRKVFKSEVLDARGRRLHGKINARFGTLFLRKNPEFLQ